MIARWVLVAQLNKLKVAKAIGSLPENVNFGIKASTVGFLTSAGLPTKWSNRTEKKSTKELAQIAKNQTVMVVCNPDGFSTHTLKILYIDSYGKTARNTLADPSCFLGMRQALWRIVNMRNL